MDYKKDLKGTFRKFVFTCYKMDVPWKEIYEEYNDIIRFIIVGKEITPTTDKLHWQGYIQFYEPCRYTKFQFMIEEKCWMKHQKGSDFQASEYCKKDHQYLIYGEPTKQGARNDLESIKKMIDNNASHSDCYIEHFGTYLRYRNKFDKYRESIMMERAKKFRKVNVKILSGPTRCGKTRKYLYDDKGNYNNNVFLIHCSHDDKLWFDGYEGQKTIIFDEFRNDIKLGLMLGLTEGHFCRLQIKGGHVYALWDKVIITTNLRKSEIYPNTCHNLIAPFWARVSEFVNMYPKCHEVREGNTKASLRSLNIFYQEETEYHASSSLKQNMEKPLTLPEVKITSDFTSGNLRSFPLFLSTQKSLAHGFHSSFAMVKKESVENYIDIFYPNEKKIVF